MATATMRALRRQRSSSVNSISSIGQHSESYSNWMDDELCSVCSRPVEKSGSLYCSSECRHQDELGGSSGPSSRAMAPSTSDPALSRFPLEASSHQETMLNSLRYSALASPSLSAVQSSPNRTRKHQHHLSLEADPAQVSPLHFTSDLHASAPAQPGGRQPFAGPASANGRWSYRSQLQQGRLRRGVPSSSTPAAQQQARRGSSSSSRSSSPESSDPTTPSPQIWATSAPHPHAIGEPSALMLPPSMHDSQKRGMHVGRDGAVKGGAPDSMPSPSTLANIMRFTRRPSNTAQPPPVLFSSPVLSASRVNARAGTAQNAAVVSKSRTNTPAFNPALPTVASTTGGSGSDTSDLDLHDADHSSGESSGFSLGPSTVSAAAVVPERKTSPLSHTVALPAESSTSPLQSSKRLASDSVLPSSRRSSVGKANMSHSFTAPPAQLTMSTAASTTAEAAQPAAPVQEGSSDDVTASNTGRGRSKARGPRSSSRRRSPSPPRRDYRRVSSQGVPEAESLPASPLDNPTIPLAQSLEADDDGVRKGRMSASSEVEERPRGRQAKRSSLLLSRGAGSLGRETINEQSAVGAASG